jgi:hypothetical protein
LVDTAASLDVDDVFSSRSCSFRSFRPLIDDRHNDGAELGSAKEKGKAGYRKGKKTVFRNASATKRRRESEVESDWVMHVIGVRAK